MQEQVELNARKQQQRIQQEQRKFRNLESDQKYYTDEIMIFIKKQKGTIEKLQKQNISLKDVVTKLYEKKGETNKYQEVEDTNKLYNIKEQIREQKQKQDQTKAHINNFQKKIVEKKNYFGGYNSGSEIEMNLQKQIRILENRLDKANQKFNQAIAFNKDLKSNIEGLRKERKIFDALYDKLEKELQNKRKSMANIIEKTNNAYEQRDKANYTADIIRQDSKKQAGDFEKQLKQLSHVILKSKLSTTLVPTIKKQQIQKSNPFYEDPNAKTLSKSLKEMKNKMHLVQSQKLQKYREDFAKIQAATQVQNFKDLIKIFIENEEKNFKIFRFINEQSNEIEELTEGIDHLKGQIAEYQKLVKNPMQEKENQIAQLRQKLRVQTMSMNLQQESNKKLNRTITNIISQIQNLFNSLECDRQVAKQLSGTKIISDSNMVIFLSIIEEKILKLVSMYKNRTKQATYSDSEGQDDVQYIYLGEKRGVSKKNPEHLLMMESDDEDEDEINNLMTYDDFMKKATEKIHEQNQKKKVKTRVGRKKNDFKY